MILESLQFPDCNRYRGASFIRLVCHRRLQTNTQALWISCNFGFLSNSLDNGIIFLLTDKPVAASTATQKAQVTVKGKGRYREDMPPLRGASLPAESRSLTSGCATPSLIKGGCFDAGSGLPDEFYHICIRGRKSSASICADWVLDAFRYVCPQCSVHFVCI